LDEISQGPKRDPRPPSGRWLAAAAAAGLIAAAITLLVTSTTPARPGASPRSPGTGTVTALPAPSPVPAGASLQLTLRNDSAATVRIDGFRTVFHDAHGTEAGSDQETINEVFLSTGQSFTWREYSQVNTEGSGSGLGTATIPAISATCQLVTLYSPAAS